MHKHAHEKGPSHDVRILSSVEVDLRAGAEQRDSGNKSSNKWHCNLMSRISISTSHLRTSKYLETLERFCRPADNRALPSHVGPSTCWPCALRDPCSQSTARWVNTRPAWTQKLRSPSAQIAEAIHLRCRHSPPWSSHADPTIPLELNSFWKIIWAKLSRCSSCSSDKIKSNLWFRISKVDASSFSFRASRLFPKMCV